MPGTVRLPHLFIALILPAIAFFANPARSHGQDDNNVISQLPDVVQKMLQTQVTWDRGFDHPPGSHLRFVKLDEMTKPDGHFFRYRIYADAASEDTPYTVMVWRIGTATKELKEIWKNAYVNRKGLLLTKKPKDDERDSDTVGDGTELDIAVKVARGEPVRIVISSKHAEVLIAGTLVPAPIESLDHGCHLTALLGSPDGEAVLIEAEGFPPNTTIPVSSTSENEAKSGSFETDANGRGTLVELPYVIGKDKGTLTDSVSTGACSVSVAIPWGKGTYQTL